MNQSEEYELLNAIQNYDVFTLRRLTPYLNDAERTVAHFISIYEGNYDACKILMKLGIRYDMFALRYDVQSFGYNNIFDRSTPLIDLLRMKYFEIADVIFKHGFRIHFTNDADDNIIYELFRACNEPWFTRITKNNYSFHLISHNSWRKYLTNAVKDNDSTLIDKIISLRKLQIDNFLKTDLLCIAGGYGSYEAAKKILNYTSSIILSRKEVHKIIYSTLLDNYNKDIFKISRLSLRNFDRVFNQDLEKFYLNVHSRSYRSKFISQKNDKDSKSYLNLWERKSNILKLILNYPHDINHQDVKGDSFLHIALQLKLNECALLLIKNGADPNILNKMRKTPIYYSTNIEIVSLLLAAGARVNILDSYNYSPFEEILFEEDILRKYNDFAASIEIFLKNPAPLLNAKHSIDIFKHFVGSEYLPINILKYLGNMAALQCQTVESFSELLKLSCENHLIWMVDILLQKWNYSIIFQEILFEQHLISFLELPHLNRTT